LNYVERLENVTVLGAAGKMGSGIVLLTAMEMADLRLKPENRSRQFVLNAVDVSEEALAGLMKYLRAQVIRAAEKKTVLLRNTYIDRSDLVENSEIIDEYVFDVLSIVRPTTKLETAYDARLVFEAINEDLDLKVRLLSQIEEHNPRTPWFFTNTSSIPIHELDERVGLGGRAVGFHFYNPPAVQRLVELIHADTTKDDVAEFARVYAKNLRKTVVPSNDIAGFIGNGHFMRDALHGIAEVERLVEDIPFVEALYCINRVSQDWLIRPMGIFQLIDYVGLDVCQCIMRVMDQRLESERVHSPLLDRLVSLGVMGGQYADGSQKNGFLKYEKGRPVAVFDPDAKTYSAVSGFQAVCDQRLGPLPESAVTWKALLGHPAKGEALAAYFGDLARLDTMGAKLARRYGRQSRQIALNLVSDNVANSEEDVNTVLLTGFYHAYGPINDYFV
jgi:3-hydroxyacyl-CoA dehydrogenase